MTWHLVVARSAQKEIEGAPVRDRTRILGALEELAMDPFSGDIAHLKGRGALDFRRRVGSWRILFTLNREARMVEVTAVLRRTSTTY